MKPTSFSRTLAASLLAIGGLSGGSASAVSDVKPPHLAYSVRTLQDDAEHGFAAHSPSGRYVAWRLGTEIYLYDSLRDVIEQVPGGPYIEPGTDPGHENLRLSDTHLAWRRAVVRGTPDGTELFLYDLKKRTRIEIWDNTASSVDPRFVAGRWLVFEGGLFDPTGDKDAHVIVYDLETGSTTDLSPTAEVPRERVHDGKRIAWIQLDGPVINTHDSSVWTHDLRTGKTELLDDTTALHINLTLTGDTVAWRVFDPPARRVATLRPAKCDQGAGLAAMLPLAGLWMRRSARRSTPTL